MTASGLGVTDISLSPPNDPSYIGGLSREFYQRVGQAYGSSNPVYYFEPKVAEAVFRQMLTEAGVTLFTTQLLASATMVSNRITQITMENGRVFRARQFIDTTYEGDLMAAAGVTFTWGREATSAYNESIAGIRSLGGSYNYDPYVVPGNPASGLLPLVQTNTGGNVGDGDKRLQAYNFRLCLTQNATNKVAITAPTNYSEANYELVRRYVAARVAANGSVSLGQLIHIQTIIPNGKTDINANGELSTDWVGYNYTWATNNYAGREQIRAAHENYIRGLLYFYATSPNVPANLNTEAQSWGLAMDEFTDNNNWPWQIYVREARRMVSDYVMTLSNFESQVIAPDGVCLARYNVDSHGVQRLVSGGFAKWEGSIGGVPPFPYPISYRSLIPRTGECANVFSTFALSASHVAFASCRMEPVFMMTSHAAGVAAALAIDDNVPVQQLNYAKLAAQLRAEGQVIVWTNAVSSTNGVILDQGGPGTANSTGWSTGANSGGWGGNFYFHDGATGKGTKWVSYRPTLPTNGTYEVYAWWVSDLNRATNTPMDIIHAAGTNRVLVNQRLSSGGWFKLMTTNFNAGTNGLLILRNDNTTAGQYCIADGIRFLGIGSAAPVGNEPVIEIVASDAVAEEFTSNRARFSFVRNGDTSFPLTVQYNTSGSATAGGDFNALPGSVTLANGAVATNVFITPLSDFLSEGDETVTLTLIPSASYQLTALSNATVVIRDRPLDAWRAAGFTMAELANPAVSGDLANPDDDSLANLMEYGLGLPPKVANADPFQARIEAGYFTLTYTRNKSATDVALVLETSNELTNWSANPALIEQTACVDEGAAQRITVRLTAPVSGVSPAYVRLRVQRL
jgi:hypothetical protein